MSSRFTIDGDDELESRLSAICDLVAGGVRRIVPTGALEAILLGGGYGRGEGGVRRTGGADLPYNDMEYYICIHGWTPLNERRYQRPLHGLCEAASKEAGIEIEFKVISQARLRSSKPSMFYYDLVAGHRVVCGPAEFLTRCEHLAKPEQIPLAEASRLLMNRCSGLLFAAERLQRKEFTSDDADFVGRNLAKAQMAFGDAVLAAHRLYHWSCRERHRRLAALAAPEPWVAAIKRHHADGVEFKLHPLRSTETRESLAARHDELSRLGREIWLWTERQRLNASFSSIGAYLLSRSPKCPETSAARNRLINLRAFGWSVAASPQGERYPRERLLNSFPLLLWMPEAIEQKQWKRHLCEQLLSAEPAFSGLTAAYERIWRRFN